MPESQLLHSGMFMALVPTVLADALHSRGIDGGAGGVGSEVSSLQGKVRLWWAGLKMNTIEFNCALGAEEQIQVPHGLVERLPAGIPFHVVVRWDGTEGEDAA